MYEPAWREIPERRTGYSMMAALGMAFCCLAAFLVLYGIAEAATDEPAEPDIRKEAFAYEPGDLERPETPEAVPVPEKLAKKSARKKSAPDISEEPKLDDVGGDEVEPEGETWIDAEPVSDVYDGEDEPEYYEPVDEQMDGGTEDDGENVGVSGYYTAGEFQFEGRVYDGDREYTWYSEQVLPGGGLDIPGRHVDEDGYIRDGDGNLCCASSGYSYGEKIEVPFGDGTAVVYDITEGEADNLVDMYVSW